VRRSRTACGTIWALLTPSRVPSLPERGSRGYGTGPARISTSKFQKGRSSRIRPKSGGEVPRGGRALVVRRQIQKPRTAHDRRCDGQHQGRLGSGPPVRSARNGHLSARPEHCRTRAAAGKGEQLQEDRKASAASRVRSPSAPRVLVVPRQIRAHPIPCARGSERQRPDRLDNGRTTARNSDHRRRRLEAAKALVRARFMQAGAVPGDYAASRPP
jgi:hypothetical protein